MNAKRYALLGTIYVSTVYLSILSLDHIIRTHFTDMMLLSRIAGEDRFLEVIGAGSLFITGILYLLSAGKERSGGSTRIKWLFCLVLALVFIFGAGEEISWGQRIFGVETPESWAEINVQDELTLHNLRIGMFDMTALTRRAFNLFWFGLVVFIPFAAVVSKRFGFVLERYIPVPALKFAVPFLMNYAILRLIIILTRDSWYQTLHAYVAEISESNFSVLFMLVAIYQFTTLSVVDRKSGLQVDNAEIEVLLSR